MIRVNKEIENNLKTKKIYLLNKYVFFVININYIRIKINFNFIFYFQSKIKLKMNFF